MRVGELSRRSGVSVPSIKYYLREGMLPAGERTGPNQADYGDEHVRRLRLVRALLDVGGLSVAATKEVLGAVDDDAMPLHEALGVAQAAVNPVADPVDDDAMQRAVALVDDLLERRGWQVYADNPGRRAAANVLASYDRLGWPELAAALDLYAETMEAVARREVAAVLGENGREQTVAGTVTGIVLGERLIAAVRTMAQEDASSRRLDPAPHDPAV